MMRILIAAIAAASVAGCANLKFQWSASYMTDNIKPDLQQTQPVAVPARVIQ